VVTLDQGGWLGPDADVRPAPAPLSELIVHAFVLDVRRATQPSWMILPDYSAHVLARIEDGPRGPHVTACSLVGPRTRPTMVDVRRRAWTVGVRLQPGALPVLTGLPASDLADAACAAGEAWGAAGDRLDARVSGEAGAEAVLAHLLAFLGARARRKPWRDWEARGLSRRVLESGGTVRVDRAAEALGLSTRALRARSHDLVGLSPKRFARTHRLFRAMDLARASRAPAWGRIAVAAGYADQPHMVREFGALLGETPARFHARGARRADSFNTAS
jgi:AraC-like DNA-binding protein